MDATKAARVAEALGVDLTCPEEYMPYVNEIAVLLDERDSLSNAVAEVQLEVCEVVQENERLRAELAATNQRLDTEKIKTQLLHAEIERMKKKPTNTKLRYGIGIGRHSHEI